VLDWLFRSENPDDERQVGLFGEKQTEVEGFALTSPKGRPAGRVRPGQGTQRELVSRKVSREQMERMRERERELEERRAKKKRKTKKNPGGRMFEHVIPRPAAAEAAVDLVRYLDLRDISDPDYLGNVIEASVQRVEEDPNSPMVERQWSGRDPLTHLTYGEMEQAINRARSRMVGVDPVTAKAAGAAAISVARSFSHQIRGQSNIPEGLDPIYFFLEIATERIAQQLSRDTSQSRIADVERALAQIQAHRRALGMRPLDVHATGWTEEDVLLEAQRLGRLSNPMQDLKHRLI
jgi:hypothetical protein